MKNAIKLLSLTFLILLSTSLQAYAVSKISGSAQSSILKDINDKGEAIVLVELSSEQSERALAGDISDENRRSAISRVQQRLQTSLSVDDRQRIKHSYEFVPGVVMSVDQASLARLQENALVKGVFQNRMNKATLSESVDLVFPKHANSRFTGDNKWAVAVLDTGVDKNHSFMKTGTTKKVISEACYSGGKYPSSEPRIDSLCPGNAYTSTVVNSGLNCSGYTGCDHGTHVAGIAAGNGTSFDGVARLGKVIAIQVFTGIRDYYNQNECGTGVGRNCIGSFDVDILRGLERVYKLRNTYNIASVNMSLGGGKYSGYCDGENSLITRAIKNLKNAGIATVIASGNDGYSSAIGYPACISYAVAVGATYDAGSSRDKPASYSNDLRIVDLYAPGSYIVSSVPGGSFSSFNGTSMAAPHVAGAWAVLKQANPEATVNELLGLLKTVGPNVKSRNGRWTIKRLDVQSALDILAPVYITPILPMLLKSPPPK